MYSVTQQGPYKSLQHPEVGQAGGVGCVLQEEKSGSGETVVAELKTQLVSQRKFSSLLSHVGVSTTLNQHGLTLAHGTSSKLHLWPRHHPREPSNHVCRPTGSITGNCLLPIYHR